MVVISVQFRPGTTILRMSTPCPLELIHSQQWLRAPVITAVFDRKDGGFRESTAISPRSRPISGGGSLLWRCVLE